LGLGRYLGRRAVYTIVLLIFIVLFNFFLFQILPFITSCPGQSYMRCVELLYVPQQAPPGVQNPAQWLAHMKEIILNQYGFNRPIPVRLYLYFMNMFTFQFGYNIHALGGTVANTISLRLPFTVLLLGFSTIASFIIGIGLGVVASAKRGKALDISSLAVLLFVNSLPVFFLGAMLEISSLSVTGHFYLPVGAKLLNLRPGFEYYTVVLNEMFLPFVTLTLAGIGGVFLTQRAVMIDTMAEDYVLMARAKGVPERTVLYKHALRNAVLPIATAFALSIVFILSGAVITETVFQWPGLGEAIYIGVTHIDFPLEQAMFFIISVMVLIAIFMADVMYGFLDPRVSTG
jgi:peptide/nickel transport system permease protein